MLLLLNIDKNMTGPQCQRPNLVEMQLHFSTKLRA